MESGSRVLVVEDDVGSRSVLRRYCSSLSLDVHEAERGDEGLRLLENNEYSLLLSDYMMPGLDGIELVEKARLLKPEMPIILVTGYATVERAVRAMSVGADHVLEKPIDITVFVNTVQAALARHAKKPPPSEGAEAGLDAPLGFRFISLFQGRMQQLAQLLDRVSRTDCTVLIRGESGTGKELVAHAIHDRSQRCQGPFVPVNCGAIPESLLESELFGHQRGAFSGAYRDRPGRFALADGGTIFLDEVGEMSPAFQVKLLRVLQEHQFEPVGGTKAQRSNFRVVTATHRDLRLLVEEGRFREDLFYRINVMEITIPALRERLEDLPGLLGHFVAGFNHRHQLNVTLGEDRFLNALRRYPWPGNIREFENLIERLCILRGEGTLEVGDLPPQILASAPALLEGDAQDFTLPEAGTDFYKAVEEFENNLIQQALEKTNGNKNKAAAMLSLNRTTLVEKMKKKGFL